jgi:hypothetical protein
VRSVDGRSHHRGYTFRFTPVSSRGDRVTIEAVAGEAVVVDRVLVTP